MTSSTPRDPSWITNHAFVPRPTGWWTVCAVCGLAEAAHRDTTLEKKP